MSPAIDDGRRDKRYDCFISMPGSQKLTDLGFSWAEPHEVVRGLAEDVYHELRKFYRNPSVFYDRKELKGDEYRKDLSKAVLQLRGGGVALVLFSAEYLKRKWCLGELNFFLNLSHRLHENRAREAVVIRVVHLEPYANIEQALGVGPVNDFVGDVKLFQSQDLEQANSVSQRPQVVNQICGHVINYWKDNESICLGKAIHHGVHWMRRSFQQDASSVASLFSAFKLTQDESSPDCVFDKALRGGKFGGSSPSGSLSDTLEALMTLIKTTPGCSAWNDDGTGGAEKALTAFGQKWDSTDWEWSIERGNRGTCLLDSVAKAATVLKEVGDNDTSPSAVAGPSSFDAVPPPVLLNGDTFHSPHLPAGQHWRVGLEAGAATRLGKLKESVLSSARGQSQHMSTSEPRRIALTSIHGEAGVGKTSTCKLLCADEEVRKEYSDGAIIWINVGRGATEEGVMGELKAAVLDCGGKRTAEEIQSSGDIFKAVKIASEFFEKRRLLVVVDNVWESTNSPVGNWGLVLSEIASWHGSVVIMTTLFQALAKNREFNRVHLGRFDLSTAESPDWDSAEKLYDERIGATDDDITNAEYTDNRRKALVISCGLPLGISTFAALVLQRQKCIGGAGSILTQIHDKVVKLVDESAGNVPNEIGHNGLFCAMEECLIHLDVNDSSSVILFPPSPRMNREGKVVPRVFDASYSAFPEKSLSSRYAALAMMPTSSTRLPFSTLRYLWHVKTSKDAEGIARIFANIGLGSYEDPSSGQEGGFSLHDLQYQFCTHKSESFSGSRAGNAAATCSYWSGLSLFLSSWNTAAMWSRLSLFLSSWNTAAKCSYWSGHSLFLSSCESFLDPVEASDDLGTGWVGFCLKERSENSEHVLADYLRRNLFHHILAIASKIGTDDGLDTLAGIIMCILCDFRWIRGRYVADGRVSILSDCSSALEMKVGGGADSGHGEKLLTARREAYVRGLQSALISFEDDVSLSSDGTLASFLVQRAGSTMGASSAELGGSYIRKLASSAEKRAHGPVLKALAGCGRCWDVGVSKKRSFGRAVAVAALGDGAHFVSGMDDGLVRLHESRHLETILSLEGHPGRVNCVAVANIDSSDNKFLIFCGSHSENGVRGWEVGLGAKGAVSKPIFTVGNCKISVRCLAVSSGGSLVAAGCADGHVFIWRRRDGADSRGFELATEFCFSPGGLTVHSVSGVVVSDRRDFVAASTCSGKIASWSRMGGQSDGVWERPVAESWSRPGTSMKSLLLSKDQSKLVLVFFHQSRARGAGFEVWDVPSRKLLPPFARFSTLTYVTCATLVYTHETGNSLFVGCRDLKNAHGIAGFSTGGERKEIARYYIPTLHKTLCGIKVGTERKLLVGGMDGYFHAIDLKTRGGVLGASGDAESSQQSVSPTEAASSVPELAHVSAVAVMPVARVVVAGHVDGRFSLWKAESGDYLSAPENDVSGNSLPDMVTCIDISGDESWAVSGHWSGSVIVWKTSASTWTRRFDIKRESWPFVFVVCVSILEGLERIVSVDSDGVLQVWDGRTEKEALFSVRTGLESAQLGDELGAHCLRGRFFLWAIPSLSQKGPWEWKLIDLENGRAMFPKETNNSHSRWRTWEDVQNDARSHLTSKNLASGKEEEPFWKPAATRKNYFAQLCGPDAGRSRDLWTIWRGSRKSPFPVGYAAVRLNCVLRSPNASTSAEAALDIDSEIESIVAAWLPRSEEGDSRRRAVVACSVRDQPHPSIVQLIVP